LGLRHVVVAVRWPVMSPVRSPVTSRVAAYVGKRLGQAGLVLWAAYTLSFLLLSALPGDSVHNRIQNPEAQISPEAAKVMLAYYGLDRPLAEQYLHALGGVFRGEFGYSLSSGKS